MEITLPEKLTPDVAEILGIILGDGHLEYGKAYKNSIRYSIVIAGSLSEDKDYYINEISPIFFKLFNKNLTITNQRKDELIVRIYSKAIAYFFKELGVMPGNKTDNNIIPSSIIYSDYSIKTSFIRGIFDTDGSIAFKKDHHGIHSKPVLSLTMKSKNFVYQLNDLLISLGFKPYLLKEEITNKGNKKHLRYRLELPGKKNLKKFMEIINFRNPKHLTKISIWNKFNFYPPLVPYAERLKILNGQLNPNSFYKYA